MSDSRLWRAIERDLRRMPATDEAAGIDRVMSAVRGITAASPLASHAMAGAPRRRPGSSALAAALDWLTSRTIVLAPAHVLVMFVVLAVGIAVLTRRNDAALTAVPGVASTTPSVAVATVVSTRPALDGTHEVRFLFVADSAHRVSVAGDFNDWNPTATPLRRVGDGNVWSAVVRIQPGRHLYAFVVDDSTWVSDATAPRAPETEFGGESSVLFVSRQS